MCVVGRLYLLFFIQRNLKTYYKSMSINNGNKRLGRHQAVEPFTSPVFIFVCFFRQHVCLIYLSILDSDTVPGTTKWLVAVYWFVSLVAVLAVLQRHCFLMKKWVDMSKSGSKLMRQANRMCAERTCGRFWHKCSSVEKHKTKQPTSPLGWSVST